MHPRASAVPFRGDTVSAAAVAARLRGQFGWDRAAPWGSVPALILLSGLPGTGKSHLAAKIAAHHPAAVVRSDEVRKLLYSRPAYTSRENGFVYLVCYALLAQLLAGGYTAVFDATNLTRDSRKRARKLAREAGAPALTLLTVAPPDVVAHRLQQRTTGAAEAYASDAGWAVHENLAATVQAMNAAHEPYVLVDTSKEIVPVLRLVDEFLARARASAPALEAQQAS